MRILLTGKHGQLGWELGRSLAPVGEVLALDRASLDLADRDQIVRRVREIRPGLIVNAAAYTAVDRAESEPELAARINAVAPRILAEEAQRLGALLIHYSTDYVFDGDKGSPYDEADPPNPVNAYGRSKLEGERGIQASGCRHLILRTGWVYGGRGGNFLLTILRLAGEREELQVVDDQIGAPTWCRDIAAATARMTVGIEGLYHLAAGGQTSWYGFAREILRRCGFATRLVAIPSAQYKTVARRPANSTLSCERLRRRSGLSLPDWAVSLERCLADGGLARSPR
ncbi:MAG TPA: dTDP-4-dehydrorhamnose reductase [Burkholderiales bacterium]|nr:dTDP-4-dehydrorhamnose reductase [Burkholderiales bacterium]